MSRENVIRLAAMAGYGTPRQLPKPTEAKLTRLIALAKAEEREACASLLTLTPAEVRLMAGELTAQEMRTVQAVLAGLQAQMRAAG